MKANLGRQLKFLIWMKGDSNADSSVTDEALRF